tara:strand:- start:72 stop:395 length:324 start_codon:yes stop_codon:yes gene_type:complete
MAYKMDDLIDAIRELDITKEFDIHGNTYEDITWKNGSTPISKNDLETKITAMQSDYSSKKYQRDRAVAYKQLKEQLDLLYHDFVSDKGDKTGEWFKHIKAVKDANPK